jgi:hypothetical protein
MRQYLLGQAREEDRVALEDAYLADDGLFEELEAAETDLIDDYVRGRLTGADRAAFEARCLSSPRLRERVAFARQLAARISRSTSGLSWWERAWDAIRLRPVLIPAMATVALVLAVAVGWWTWHTEPGLGAPGVRQAGGEAPARPSADTSAAPGPAAVEPPPVRVLALTLVPGLVRAAGEVATLAIATDVRSVEMRLEHEGPVRSEYRAAIRTPEGKTTWEQARLRPAGPAKPVVVTTVPAAALPAGDYIVTLSSAEPGRDPEVVAEYAVRVVRR